ncbi:MAG: penicillin-binding protein 2 [bacterium]|nr:penicillin-binding protein 2 [bacterium]
MLKNRFGRQSILRETFAPTVLYGTSAPRGSGARLGKSPRWVLFLALLIIAFVLGLGRLVDLQLFRGSYFRSLAEGNRIRRIPIKAPRGEILDRTGESLARNIPVYRLATFGEGGVVVETKEIPREEALRIESTDPGEALKIIVDIGREYPLGEAAAHVVGYVNEASPQEVGNSPVCGEIPNSGAYALGDLVGRIGIETQYECVLRGTNGEELIEVDTRGRLVRKLGRKEPVSGKSITLSIDGGLQQAAYHGLVSAPNEKGTRPAIEDGITVRGAVVAQDPGSGEILALVSAPSFDPGAIGDRYAEWAKDPNMPFFNRATGGSYHPGSTFKIVVATAGLEEGKINKDFEFDDPGILRVGDFSYANWYFTQYGRTEGLINIVRAITRSTDTFFYKVGELVGPEKLASWAEKFGLGEKTGVDLSGEVPGLVPTPEWKEKVKGERWFLGNTYHMSIGQGDVTATPLQINNMTSVIANGGKLCGPHLIKEATQNSKFETLNSKCEDLGLRPETVQLITEGMVGACSTGGTAFPLFNFKPQVACKTGTAEFGDSEDRTHAWLTAFASDEPEIVVTALVEAGGEGSRVAAPVVKEVLDYWFHKR